MVEIDILARLVVAAILFWAAAAKLVARDPARLESTVFRALFSHRATSDWYSWRRPSGRGCWPGFPSAPLGAIAARLCSSRSRSRTRAHVGFGGWTAVAWLEGARSGSPDRASTRLYALAGLAAFRLEVSRPSAGALVVIALVILSVAVVTLAALVLALYRQVGLLTLRLGPGVALELAERARP